MIVYHDDKGHTGLVKHISQVPRHGHIDSVDGSQCYGLCESCGAPILEGQDYQRDSEGIMWHFRCPDQDVSKICPSCKGRCGDYNQEDGLMGMFYLCLPCEGTGEIK